MWALLFAFSSFAYAGVDEYNDKTIHLTFGIEVPGYNLEFKGLNGHHVLFSPNLSAVYTVGVSLQGLIGASYGFRARQKEADQQLKGSSHYDDWRLHYAFRHLLITMNYSQFLGFYIQNTRDVDTSWTPGMPLQQEPNLYARTAGANVTWILSPERYSLEAAMDQTARQNESGGSFLLGLAASETVFKNTGPILPSSVQTQFGSAGTLYEGRFLALTAKGGFGYTLVLARKYFLSGAAQLGFGEQRNLLSGTDFSRTQWASAAKGDAFLSLGYNGDDIFWGLNLYGDGTIFNADSIQILSTLWAARMFLGIRL